MQVSVVMQSDDGQDLRATFDAIGMASPSGVRMSLGTENDLVDDLYDAALGRLAWQDVGERLTGLMEGMTLMLSAHHQRGPHVDVVATVGIAPQHLQEYAYFAPHDLWATAALERRAFG